MTHLGTLLAILIYFWRDVWRLSWERSCCSAERSRTMADLALYILIGTIPAISVRLHTQEAEHPGPRAKCHRRCLEHGDLRHAHACRRHVRTVEKTINDVTLRERGYHWMRAGACPHSGYEPFRRHHDGRPLPEFHPLRCGPLLLPARHPATAAAIVLTLGDAIQSGCHITYDEVLVAGLTFVAGILAIAF